MKILITNGKGNIGKTILKNIVSNSAKTLFRATRHLDLQNADELFFDFENLKKTQQSLYKIDIFCGSCSHEPLDFSLWGHKPRGKYFKPFYP